MIDNNLEHLEKSFKQKVIVFQKVVSMAYKNLHLFEWFRTAARQKALARTVKWPVAKPWTSYHEKWLACDRTRLNTKWQPTWNGDYKFLQFIWGMCGMIPVKGESCHLQDDKKTIQSAMKNNSARYQKATAIEQMRLKRVNTAFRQNWFVS